MKKSILTAVAVTALLASGYSIAGGDVEAGKTKAAVCGACHGADGNSINPDWPSLAGQGAGYLFKQLSDFKNNKRSDATMAPQVATLSEQDMHDLAAYFSSQTAKAGKADQNQIELGEAVYRGGNSATGVAACIGCHGPTGSGNPAAKFPKVSGQHAAYTEAQLNAFQSSARNNDAGKMMRNLTIRLTDAEIKAVSQYIAGLK